MSPVAMDEHTFAVMVLFGCVFSNCMAHKNFSMSFNYVPGSKQARIPICEALNISGGTSCVVISFNGSHSSEGKYWTSFTAICNTPLDV